MSFETQTDHIIPAISRDQVLFNQKRTCQQVNFALQWTMECDNKRKRKNKQIIGSCNRGLWNMEMTVEVPVV